LRKVNIKKAEITFDFEIFDGDIFQDGENKLQAHLAVITSQDQVEQVLTQLKNDPEVAEATHNIWAYRIFDVDKNTFIEHCDDDGDDSSGARVLRFLQRTDAMDVMVVVTCWYETTADDLGPVRFKYTQKSVLDLLMMRGRFETTTSTKSYLKEIKYTPFYQEKIKKPEYSRFVIFHGEPVKDRKSTFQAHSADITSRNQVDEVLDELMKDRKISKATYNMWACRIFDEKKKTYLEESDDDGENLAGGRLLHLLQRSDAKNVVIIVTRWHGGKPLGNDRFKHINSCAVDLLQSRGLIRSKSHHPKKSSQGSSKVKRKGYY
jgi:putative IMPACT (imprinted ancient) family translation regulator